MNRHTRETKTVKYTKMIFIVLLTLMIGSAYMTAPAYSIDSSARKAYYVSVDGNDGNPGTLTAPWRTIQKAADTLAAGETVFVREGLYEEFVQIKHSGSTQEGHITFQAYPGETPVLEGKNLKPSGINNTQLLIRGASYVTVQGFEIRGLTTNSSKDYLSGMKVRGGGSNIVIANNDIHAISNYATKGNAHGLIVYGDSVTPISKITITGNTIHHLISGSSESLTLDGNIEDFTVEYNKVHDNNNIGIDIIGHYKTCSIPCVDQARNGVVAHNLVYNIDTSKNPAYGSKGDRAAAGIYVDGGKNVIVENNEVFNSNFGIELASEIYGKSTSDVTVRNNYLHHNQGAGIMMGGSGSDNGGARDNLIVNNTLYMNDAMQQGYAEITLQNYNFNNIFANNIIYTFPKKRFIKNSETTGSGNYVDYNLYYRTDDSNSKSWRFNGVSYKTWDEFKSVTGFDTHSLYADPLFHNIDQNGPYLSAQSPAIEYGTLKYVDNIKIDYYKQLRIAGKEIDVGAAEYTSGVIPDRPIFDYANSPAKPNKPVTEDMSVFPDSKSPDREQPTSVKIKVDGISDEWVSIPERSTGQANVRSMKAFISGDLLYVLLDGHLLTEKGQLFIDTGEVTPAFQSPYWTDQPSGFLIENGTLYKYSGKGKSNWNWSKVRTYRNTEYYAVSATAIEYAIPLAELGRARSAIFIGYVWKDSHSDKLPLGSKMEFISL